VAKEEGEVAGKVVAGKQGWASNIFDSMVVDI
jgi:hypothetical protein